MKNGKTYSQLELDDFVIQEDKNPSKDSAFMRALGEMQAKDFSVKSLNICLESSSVYLMEIAANIFATGVICTEKMKIKLLA